MLHSKITEEFSQAVESAADLPELSGIVDAMAREMGFRYFALAHHIDIPQAPQSAIRLHNYPADWECHYDAEGLGPSDPVHRASHLRTLGFRWSKLRSIIQLTPRDEAMLERAAFAGLGEGFTIPAHIPGESAGSCSFAMRAGHALRMEWSPAFQTIGAVAFEGARRLCGIRRPDLAQPRLTGRQQDCLYWASRGKSDWEISRILGIAHETAIQHVKQARGRYGVCKRTQLTIHALYEGVITFTDALRR